MQPKFSEIYQKPIEMVPVNFAFSAGNPQKCSNPFCNNKKLITAEGESKYCGRRCAIMMEYSLKQ